MWLPSGSQLITLKLEEDRKPEWYVIASKLYKNQFISILGYNSLNVTKMISTIIISDYNSSWISKHDKLNYQSIYQAKLSDILLLAIPVYMEHQTVAYLPTLTQTQIRRSNDNNQKSMCLKLNWSR